MKEYKLKYGKGEQSVMLDESKVLQIIDAAPGEKITDLKKAVLDAVRNPVGSAPLREVVKQGDKVVILVSDITRAWTRTSEYLPIVEEELNNSGIPDADISVIVATGTHRANTDEEKKIIVGEDLYNRLKIYDHDAYDMEKNVYLGTTRRGTPVYLDKRAVEADKVILTGGITPHLFAGFGGGRKSVLPGIAAAETINHNHVMALSDTIGGGINPDTCLATFRVDIDVATCGEITPLSTLDYLIGSFDSDIITMDYRVRGFTRDIEGKKLFMDHHMTSIQDFIDPKTLERYDAYDINVYQSNLFHTRMLLKEVDLQNYLFNTDIYELPPKTRLKIHSDLRREMIEIFSGKNIY